MTPEDRAYLLRSRLASKVSPRLTDSETLRAVAKILTGTKKGASLRTDAHQQKFGGTNA